MKLLKNERVVRYGKEGLIWDVGEVKLVEGDTDF